VIAASTSSREFKWYLPSLWVLVVIGGLLYALHRPVPFLDESAYLARGAEIVEQGKFPRLELNPGVSLFHALSYSLLQNHPLGLEWAGRITAFIAFVGTAVALYLAVQELTNRLWAILATGVYLLYPPANHVLANSSDSVYAFLSGLAYALMLIALRHRRWLLLSVTSALLGAAATTRNDGTIVFIVSSGVVLWWFSRLSDTSWSRRTYLFVLAWLLPFTAVMLTIATLSWRSTGIFQVLPTRRSYVAFEQGEGVSRQWDSEMQGRPIWIEGVRLARKLYGTPQENGYSIVRAVTRNPRAFAGRLARNVRGFFLMWNRAHEQHGAPIILVLFIGGMLTLLWRKRAVEGLATMAFLVPWLIYSAIFWRQGYINVQVVIILSTSAYLLFEATSFSSNYAFAIAVFTIILCAPFVFFVAQYTPRDFNGTFLLSIIVVVASFVLLGAHRAHFNTRQASLVPFGVLIAVLLVSSTVSQFGLPRFWWHSDSSSRRNQEYRAFITFAFQELPANTKIFCDDPSLIALARQVPFCDPSFLYNSQTTVSDVLDQMSRRGMEYILVQPLLIRYNKSLADALLTSSDLVTVFRTEHNTVVLLKKRN